MIERVFKSLSAIATVGAAMAHLLTVGDAHEERALALTCGIALGGALLAMAVILVSTAGGDPASRRRRAMMRVGGAAAVFVIALLGQPLTSPAFLAAMGGVLVLQVVVDVLDSTRREVPAA